MCVTGTAEGDTKVVLGSGWQVIIPVAIEHSWHREIKEAFPQESAERKKKRKTEKEGKGNKELKKGERKDVNKGNDVGCR